MPLDSNRANCHIVRMQLVRGLRGSVSSSPSHDTEITGKFGLQPKLPYSLLSILSPKTHLIGLISGTSFTHPLSFKRIREVETEFVLTSNPYFAFMASVISAVVGGVSEFFKTLTVATPIVRPLDFLLKRIDREDFGSSFRRFSIFCNILAASLSAKAFF